MYCDKCGTFNAEGNRFCKQCGNVLRTADKTDNGAKTGKLGSFLLSLVIGLVGAGLIIAGLFAMDVLHLKYSKDTSNKKENDSYSIGIEAGKNDPNNDGSYDGHIGRIENKGYDSAAEAVRAFADALIEENMEDMISMFAIENYNEHYDFESLIERIHLFQFKYYEYFPVPENDLSLVREYNTAHRRAEVIRELDRVFVGIALYGGEYEGHPDTVYPVESERDLEVFVDLLKENIPRGSSMTVKGVFTPQQLGAYFEGIDDIYYREKAQEGIDTIERRLGGEELCDLALVIEVNGKEWIICPQIACYEGRWRIVSLRGPLSEMLGIKVYDYAVPLLELQQEWGQF